MCIRKTMYIILLSCTACVIGLTGLVSFSYAQENMSETQNNPPVDQAESEDNLDPIIKPTRVLKTKKNVSYPSLFFTHWQYEAIQDVKNSWGFVRPPTEEELNNEEEFVVDRGIRELMLGGIVYKAEDNWVIYLNNERVKPNSIPEEILDLKVFKQHIEIKWLDEYTNTIYPIRLKPHQRFNLDQRIFLSGE